MVEKIADEITVIDLKWLTKTVFYLNSLISIREFKKNPIRRKCLNTILRCLDFNRLCFFVCIQEFIQPFT